MHVHELPPEIWALISSHLSRAELLPLCLASSTLLAVIRPIYYRFVTLHRDHRAWTALSLLARDKGLAERVVKLQLIGSTKRRRCWTIVHPHGFTNLISLGHLVLTGRLFDDASEELQFWHLIKNKPGVPIKVLAYKLKADYDDVTSTHNPLDGLGGFTKLSWDNRGREQYSETVLFEVLTRCESTLTILSLQFHEQFVARFGAIWELCFPKLDFLSITIRDFNDIRRIIGVHALLKFIQAHAVTLEIQYGYWGTLEYDKVSLPMLCVDTEHRFFHHVV